MIMELVELKNLSTDNLVITPKGGEIWGRDSAGPITVGPGETFIVNMGIDRLLTLQMEKEEWTTEEQDK